MSSKKIPHVEKMNYEGVRMHNRPQCECKTLIHLGYPSRRCKLTACWKVDGLLLCNRHGGQVVLEALSATPPTDTVKE